MANVLIIGVLPTSLINFRGDLIHDIVQAGNQVTALSEPADAHVVKALSDIGANHIAYPVQRNGLDPLADLKTLKALSAIIKEVRPDVILAYTIKPVVWGGFASIFSGQARFYALITGLGYAFQEGGIKRKFLNFLVKNLYRISLSRATSVIFQNPDNRNMFVNNQIIPLDKSRIVAGSGVNIDFFNYTSPPKQGLVFLCVARLLGEKGLREYAEAARSVKQKYPAATFRLVGPDDPSPDGIPIEEVEAWHSDGIIDYCGSTEDVRPFIEQCHVYVLPSYHEGLPRTVIEAMSIGRAIITTDAPGCRETVVEGENGYLVSVKGVSDLANAMQHFIEDPGKVEKMGHRSREIVLEKFDVKKVNSDMLGLMGINV